MGIEGLEPSQSKAPTDFHLKTIEKWTLSLSFSLNHRNEYLFVHIFNDKILAAIDIEILYINKNKTS